MPIKVSEVGKTLDVGAFLDISSGTGVKSITVTNPDTLVKTTFPDARITTPGVVSADGYEAGTYMQLITELTDFPDGGDWPLCCRFQDASASPNAIDWYGDDGILTIKEKCEE